jgi:hypothetical protein
MDGIARSGLLAGTALAALLFGGRAAAQQNYLPLENGPDEILVAPGASSSGGNPNLYDRCFPECVLYPPTGAGSFAALDVTGFEWGIVSTQSGAGAGTPLLFFVADPGLTCTLSAAAGGGFPPTKTKILSSPNLLQDFYFYTSIPCAFPSAWWFSFALSGTSFPAPDPSVGGGNLLAGWSDKNATTTGDFQYAAVSADETSSARSFSHVNLNAAGLAHLQLRSSHEWFLPLVLLEPTCNPEPMVVGAWDVGGAGGYSPRVAPGAQIRFRTQFVGMAGTGYQSAFAGNFIQTSCFDCHVPGVGLFDVELKVSGDSFFYLFLFSGIVGTPFSSGTTWPDGGASLTAGFPITLPGLVGLQFCFGAYSFFHTFNFFDVNAASNGSWLRFR